MLLPFHFRPAVATRSPTPLARSRSTGPACLTIAARVTRSITTTWDGGGCGGALWADRGTRESLSRSVSRRCTMSYESRLFLFLLGAAACGDATPTAPREGPTDPAAIR